MKLKKYTAFMVCFLLLINLLTLPSFKVKADGTSRIFYTTDSNITVGQDFNIYVNAENITDLYGASIDFKYDTNLMTVKSIQVGDAYAGLVSGSTSSSTGADYFVVDTSDLANGTGNFGVTLLGNTHATGLAITTAKKLFVIKATAKAAGAVSLNFVSGEPTSTAAAVNSKVNLADSTSTSISFTSLSQTVNIVPPISYATSPGRYEENSTFVKFNGYWDYLNNSIKVGYSKGNTAEFNFNGSNVKVYGIKNSSKGIANVYIDGTLVQSVDTYSTTSQSNVVIFEKSGLSMANHVIKVEVSGNKNASSTGTAIVIDAFYFDNAIPVSYATTEGRYEENSNFVKFNGYWDYLNNSIKVGYSKGNTAEFNFNGSNVKVYGIKNSSKGIANVYIDGTLVQSVDTYSATSQSNVVIFEKSGLTKTNHVIKVEVSGNKNTASTGTAIVIDAFYFDNAVLSTYATTPGRYEENSSFVKFGGYWDYINSSIKVGYNKGNTSEFSFSGSNIKVYGIKNSSKGIANIYIDNILVQSVDTYSATSQNNVVIFEMSGLTNANHVIKVEVSGNKNTASTGTAIVIDAFYFDNVISSSYATSAGRYEENSSFVKFNGYWDYLNNSIKVGYTKGNIAEFYFNGTSVSIYGIKNASKGIANIYIDGVLVQSVDTYSMTSQSNVILFNKSGLIKANHVVKVEITGDKNPSSSGSAIVIDAFSFN